MRPTKGKEDRIPAMIVYSPIQMHLVHAELGPYSTYGIRVSELTETGCRELRQVADVSTDEDAVARLCCLATRGALSPVHLSDVLEDYFSS
jgi:hypothetical protein